jgi:hypothetical protein
MTENANPENRPADPERGNSLRAWLIDALALGIGALAVFHYQPDGFTAGLLGIRIWRRSCWSAGVRRIR